MFLLKHAIIYPGPQHRIKVLRRNEKLYLYTYLTHENVKLDVLVDSRYFKELSKLRANCNFLLLLLLYAHVAGHCETVYLVTNHFICN